MRQLNSIACKNLKFLKLLSNINDNNVNFYKPINIMVQNNTTKDIEINVPENYNSLNIYLKCFRTGDNLLKKYQIIQCYITNLLTDTPVITFNTEQSSRLNVGYLKFIRYSNKKLTLRFYAEAYKFFYKSVKLFTVGAFVLNYTSDLVNGSSLSVDLETPVTVGLDRLCIHPFNVYEFAEEGDGNDNKINEFKTLDNVNNFWKLKFNDNSIIKSSNRISNIIFTSVPGSEVETVKNPYSADEDTNVSIFDFLQVIQAGLYDLEINDVSINRDLTTNNYTLDGYMLFN